MKTFSILFIILLCVIVPVYFLARRQNQRILQSPVQERFLAGQIPNPEANGFFQGSVENYTGSWKGKSFDLPAQSGVNIFADTKDETQLVKQYPFKTYIGEGLQDKIDVLKIDYNIPENPFWLRMIVDEVVEVEPGHYLGKMHINAIPGYPVTLAWFQLAKAE